jgi:hypothetical protein
MRCLRLIHHVGVSLSAACGGGDGLAAPNRELRPDHPLAEAWMMSFEDMSDGGITCFTNVFPVTLVKEGATVSGAVGARRHHPRGCLVGHATGRCRLTRGAGLHA